MTPEQREHVSVVLLWAAGNVHLWKTPAIALLALGLVGLGLFVHAALTE